MFTQPAPSSPGAAFPPPPRSSTAPSSGRGSRLRGLIHLRSYTSRDNNIPQYNNNTSSNTQTQPNPLTRTTTSTSVTSNSSQPDSSNSTPQPTARTTAARPLTLVSDTPATVSDSPPATTANSDSQTPQTGSREISSLDRIEEHGQAPDAARSEPAADHEAAIGGSGVEPSMTRTRSATTGDMARETSQDPLPSVRFSAFYDARSNRPSLSFTPISRTLPSGKEIIRVGRYSERENHAQVPANIPSAHPVGFKSKVVSRRHCEFWYENGKWFIKDVKSSSGTFLNHIRLSAPGTESKPFPINDGDIVQLGIDFKGGEEMIYRCVKMRVELNRGWQAKPNTFNMATHKRLRNMADTSSSGNAQDCSICLSRISPCQSLFVAPCSHTWHYKCIRELLMGPSFPIFMCPNCRAVADLDAEVEDTADEWQQLDSNAEESQADQPSDSASQAEKPSEEGPTSEPAPADGGGSETHSVEEQEHEVGDVTMHIDSETIEQARQQATAPVPIPNATRSGSGDLTAARARRTPSPNDESLAQVTEGPITPRNDAGPWVFDGDPARVSQEVTRRNGAMTSLDAAAQGESNAA